jgi:hypothetical protein
MYSGQPKGKAQGKTGIFVIANRQLNRKSDYICYNGGQYYKRIREKQRTENSAGSCL